MHEMPEHAEFCHPDILDRGPKPLAYKIEMVQALGLSCSPTSISDKEKPAGSLVGHCISLFIEMVLSMRTFVSSGVSPFIGLVAVA